MGEEVKQEQVKPEEKVAVEEKKEEKAVSEEEMKKEEEEAKPPSPCILHVDLHCVGCAKKVEKYILKIRGVEGVVMDMGKNEVTVKGIVDPTAVCNIITKKTKRKAKLLSPLLPPAAEGQPPPQLVSSLQVSGPTTVELNVNMHCEACAEQLKRKILKMRGVQSATTELGAGKVTVTGTMDPDKLVEYVYRRTKKQARIVPQPEPEPEKKKEEEPKKEEEEGDQKPAEEKKLEEEKPPTDDEKKGEAGEKDQSGDQEEEEEEVVDDVMMMSSEEENMKRMMYYYQPLYVIEKMPPAPQLFSDENPNACCIT